MSDWAPAYAGATCCSRPLPLHREAAHLLEHRLAEGERGAPRTFADLGGDVVEVRRHDLVIVGVVEQERIVAVWRVDLRVGDVLPRGDERLHDLPRARGRE